MNLSLAGGPVVVGIDFSRHCERALLLAIELAEQREAGIELVHVFEWLDRGVGPGSSRLAETGSADRYLWAAVLTQASAARSRLGLLCSLLVGDQVPVQIRVVIGEPASRLMETAQQLRAPLLVIGFQGQRSASSGCVGTTAEQLCTSSAVPVLLVPGSGPPRKPEAPGLSLAARSDLVWSCSRCSSVQPAAFSQECTSCGVQPGIWTRAATSREPSAE